MTCRLCSSATQSYGRIRFSARRLAVAVAVAVSAPAAFSLFSRFPSDKCNFNWSQFHDKCSHIRTCVRAYEAGEKRGKIVAATKPAAYLFTVSYQPYCRGEGELRRRKEGRVENRK